MGLIEMATRLIARHGQAAEILRPGEATGGGFGTHSGGTGPETPYPCTACVAAYTVNEEYMTAGLMAVGDQRVLVSVDGLTITPENTDKLRIGGETFGIVAVVPHAHDGITRFWEVQARASQ